MGYSWQLRLFRFLGFTQTGQSLFVAASKLRIGTEMSVNGDKEPVLPSTS